MFVKKSIIPCVAILAALAGQCAAFPKDRVIPVVETASEHDLLGPALRVEYPPRLHWRKEQGGYDFQGEPNYLIYEFDRSGRCIRRALGLWKPSEEEQQYQLSSDYRFSLTEEGLIARVVELVNESIPEMSYTTTWKEDVIENRVDPTIEVPWYASEIYDYREVLRSDQGGVEVQTLDPGDREPWMIRLFGGGGELLKAINGPGHSGERVYEYEEGRLVRETGGGVTRTYTYNQDGFVGREEVETDSEKRVFVYEYDQDNRGNWIEQRVSEILPSGRKVQSWLQRRTITYYEEE